ncbi:sensor histidine kinase [Deinococcus peraridilitoris]|uniref:histidine kinase n=1 Tax=Deinococcus peraridilitoris (strain DSM 19664 / LMG 22246 / CIP 109416 / KR-200) TaxID=937777 RepID=K9ZX46_DEIPD|nr:ATP-binding protein [Deinococcus peraridilitoris]AFZ66126.1 bacteriophytochrome (light-regulated signal transduction histidine kinase) [Deinococcus peraridilitoris DSM 19664]
MPEVSAPSASVVRTLYRLLVVDDNDAGRYLTSRTLIRAGFEVLEAASGAAALERALDEPDLIVLDVNLPDMDGFEVCRQLKADEQFTHLPILMVSASHLSAQNMAFGLDVGADAYLAHPIEPTVLVATVRALLRVREAEAEVRRLNAVLERQIEERTLRLQELALDLQGMTYSISRDLRQPIGHIRGFTHLLEKRLDGALDEKALQYLNIIRQSSERMNSLIDELVAFSSLGERELRFTAVPLSQLVVQVRSDLEPLSAGRRVRWQIAELPTVQGDLMLLRQLLGNLLSNALKFSQGRDTTEIRVWHVEDEHRHTIGVSDNGIGFNVQYAERLFQMFGRLPGSESFEGAGVGLASARRIVTLHRGVIRAESVPGQGATFSFTLPKEPPH